MAIDHENGKTTQLLTLLNVSATKAGKRKWILDDIQPPRKLNKRRTVQFSEVVGESEVQPGSLRNEEGEMSENDLISGYDNDDEEDAEVDEEHIQGVFISRIEN